MKSGLSRAAEVLESSSEPRHKAFRCLFGWFRPPRAAVEPRRGVLKTNGFNCQGHAWGLWADIAFVNHSCRPNAQYVITEKEEGELRAEPRIWKKGCRDAGFSLTFHRFSSILEDVHRF